MASVQNPAFVRGEPGHHPLQGALRPRLVHPEIEQIQNGDGDHPFQVRRIGVPALFFRFPGFKGFQDLNLRMEQLELGVGVKKPFQHLFVIPLAEPNVLDPVGAAFDESRHQVRCRF